MLVSLQEKLANVRWVSRALCPIEDRSADVELRLVGAGRNVLSLSICRGQVIEHHSQTDGVRWQFGNWTLPRACVPHPTSNAFDNRIGSRLVQAGLLTHKSKSTLLARQLLRRTLSACSWEHLQGSVRSKPMAVTDWSWSGMQLAFELGRSVAQDYQSVAQDYTGAELDTKIALDLKRTHGVDLGNGSLGNMLEHAADDSHRLAWVRSLAIAGAFRLPIHRRNACTELLRSYVALTNQASPVAGSQRRKQCRRDFHPDRHAQDPEIAEFCHRVFSQL